MKAHDEDKYLFGVLAVDDLSNTQGQGQKVQNFHYLGFYNCLESF